MIYRIFADRDTFVTDLRVNGVPATGSNAGRSEILQVFRVAPLSTSLSVVSGSTARVLMRFDLSPIAALTASGDAPRAGISYRLRIKNARHRRTLPSSFDLEALPATRAWDEGRGMDVDLLSDSGFANWERPTSTTYWSSPGGDFALSPSAGQHLDEGDEDVSMDVTSIVNSWLTGGLANNGFFVKLTSSIESGSTDYYVKMLHGRSTTVAGAEPYLEASWDDSIRDDRNNFVFGVTGSLFMYNLVRGRPTDIPTLGTGSNVVTVRVSDASGTVATFSGSHAGRPGLYSASFALPTGSYSGSVFTDTWFLGSATYMTCSFTPSDGSPTCASPNVRYHVAVPDLRDEYEGDETVRLRLFVRDRDYGPAVVHTASAGPQGIVVTRAFYRVDNERTDEVVIPFGTGSVESTRLSYDRNGNYLNLHMGSLPRGLVYRLVFLFDIDGQRQLIDRGFKFRVV